MDLLNIGASPSGVMGVNKGGRFIQHMCDGETVGVSDLCTALLEHLETNHGHKTSRTNAPDILLEGKFLHRGEEKEIRSEIEKLTSTVAHDMIRKIREKWGSADDSVVFLAGGGAPFFKDVLKGVIPHIQVMDDHYRAVVKGMFNYLVASTCE